MTKRRKNNKETKEDGRKERLKKETRIDAKNCVWVKKDGETIPETNEDNEKNEEHEE